MSSINNFTYKFTTLGRFSTSLLAWNPVSFQSYSLLVEVTSNLDCLGFYSKKSQSSPNISCSIAGEKADFLFTMRTGRLYDCEIDFGDQSPLLLASDYEKALNNTIISIIEINIKLFKFH